MLALQIADIIWLFLLTLAFANGRQVLKFMRKLFKKEESAPIKMSAISADRESEDKDEQESLHNQPSLPLIQFQRISKYFGS